jgi:hypothetical protein
MARLFKSRANYVFDYKPRFYDERKERLEKLEEKYNKNDTKNPKPIKRVSLSREALKKEWRRNKHVAHDVKSNRRLAVIIAILVGIVAYIFELHKLF